ncbi:hypothetical protein AAW14_16600 [Streptomyces hygroscopicus]|uniref:hypothetical protein n=1 Tax=Streptomyces hygroscopicus TaxID=1912 RepID=UPI0022402A08|nr:hypothetical protein [Streptomyces hygroscopicus]MCW7943628.1 hypothetical protein [Streptomyces hygroscopicus]
MSTGVIIALIVIVILAAVVAGAAALNPRTRGTLGAGLRRRFGPEYERTVARHDGDTKAAERELTERLNQYGSLRERSLEASERERYATRWAAAQEHFVDSPREAVAEADRLLAELAGARGFPDGGRYEDQLDALSVHHARHVHGYRRLHGAAHAPAADGAAGSRTETEEMREALLEARALFEDLVAPPRGQAADSTEGTARHVPARADGRSRLPWTFHRQHAKGS